MVGSPDGKKELGRLKRRDGRIILQWIFKRSVGEAWTGSSWLRIWTGVGHL
jgi:hypothetical protein